MTSQERLINSEINIVPEMCSAAICRGEAAEFSCWMILRHADSVLNKGRGRFIRKTAIAWLSEMLEVTPTRIRQILQKGTEVYWRESEGKEMYISGIIPLLLNMDVTNLRSKYVVVPFYRLLVKLTHLNSMLFSFAACITDGPLAVETIADECGKSSRTIRRHLKEMAPYMIVKKNVLELVRCNGKKEAVDMLKSIRQTGEHPEWSLSIQQDENDGLYVVRRIPNSYDYGNGRKSYKLLRQKFHRRLGSVSNNTIQQPNAPGYKRVPIAVTYLDGIMSHDIGLTTVWSDKTEEER